MPALVPHRQRDRAEHHPPGVTDVRRRVRPPIEPDYRKTESLLAQIRTIGYTGPMRNKGLRVKAKGGPTIEKRTMTPRRPTNAAVRPREYLTPEEVRHLLRVARQ